MNKIFRMKNSISILAVPYDTILSNLKSKTQYKLLTRKDLYNIKRCKLTFRLHITLKLVIVENFPQFENEFFKTFRCIRDSLHPNDVLSVKAFCGQ